MPTRISQPESSSLQARGASLQSRTRCAFPQTPVLAALYGLMFCISVAGAQDRTAPDETLWIEITELRAAAQPTSQPYEAWFAAQLENRRMLASKLRAYATHYPGGAHRDDAVMLELRALFEIGCLTDGKLDALQARAEELLRSPLGKISEQEAAYWLIACRRGARAASTRPAGEPLELLDANLVDEYRTYVRQYPSARRVPRMATLLFDAAVKNGDEAAQHELAALLSAHFPQHASTEYCTAVLRRHDQIGKRFEATLATIENGTLNTESLRGHPLLIVVWPVSSVRSNHETPHPTTRATTTAETGSADDNALRVSDIEEFRRLNDDTRVIGIPIADSVEDVLAAQRRADITWLEHFDERGWAGDFVRSWGVRSGPFVFIIDADGVLRGATNDKDWRSIAASAARVP